MSCEEEDTCHMRGGYMSYDEASDRVSHGLLLT
jgi:hypothetical protein